MMGRGNKEMFTFFAIIVIFLFGINLVSAAGDLFGVSVGQAISDGLRNVEEVMSPFLQVTIGGYDTGEFFWIKFLLLILLFVVVKAGVKATPKLGENNAVANILALVVSLFAVRFISQNGLTEGILLPYGVLGVALTTILPFLLFFFFVEKTTKSPGGRKVLWSVFVLVMFLLWFNRRTELDNPITNWIYWGIILLGVFLYFYDKHVQIYFGTRVNNERAINLMREQINSRMGRYREAMQNNDETTADRIMKEIKNLEKRIHSLS